MRIAQSLASLILANVNKLGDILISGQVVIKDASAPFHAVIPVPESIDPELKSTDTIEIIIAILENFFQIQPGSTGNFKSSVSIPNCVSSDNRINQDSPSAKCAFSNSYK